MTEEPFDKKWSAGPVSGVKNITKTKSGHVFDFWTIKIQNLGTHATLKYSQCSVVTRQCLTLCDLANMIGPQAVLAVWYQICLATCDAGNVQIGIRSHISTKSMTISSPKNAPLNLHANTCNSMQHANRHDPASSKGISHPRVHATSPNAHLILVTIDLN